MGMIAYLICSPGDWSTAGNVGEKSFLLLAGIGAGLGAYFLGSYLLKNEELLFLLKMIKRKT